MPKWLKENGGKTLWVILWACLAALFSPLAIEIRDAIGVTIVNRLKPSTLFLAVVGLFILCALLLVWIYELQSRTRTIRRYEPDPEFPGLFRHKKRHDERVCPSCLITDGYISPIFPSDEGWATCFRKGCGFECQHPKHRSSLTCVSL